MAMTVEERAWAWIDSNRGESSCLEACFHQDGCGCAAELTKIIHEAEAEAKKRGAEQERQRVLDLHEQHRIGIIDSWTDLNTLIRRGEKPEPATA